MQRAANLRGLKGVVGRCPRCRMGKDTWICRRAQTTDGGVTSTSRCTGPMQSVMQHFALLAGSKRQRLLPSTCQSVPGFYEHCVNSTALLRAS